MQLLDGAEAKAYWGLALNYKPLQALVDVLVAEETINGERLTEVGHGALASPADVTAHILLSTQLQS